MRSLEGGASPSPCATAKAKAARGRTYGLPDFRTLPQRLSDFTDFADFSDSP